MYDKKYLKTIYQCHVCAGAMDSQDANGGGAVDVFDVDTAVEYFV